MNKELKIYLDTSVPNFLFADDAPEKKEITIDFFDNFLAKGKYDAFISEFVIAEIENTTNEAKRNKLFNAISKYPISVVQINDRTEVDELAQQYINAGIIPAHKVMDALHIAISTIYGFNVLVSRNYKHLANINKEHKIKIVNYQNNYYNDIRIITPLELIDYGD